MPSRAGWLITRATRVVFVDMGRTAGTPSPATSPNRPRGCSTSAAATAAPEPGRYTKSNDADQHRPARHLRDDAHHSHVGSAHGRAFQRARVRRPRPALPGPGGDPGCVQQGAGADRLRRHRASRRRALHRPRRRPGWAVGRVLRQGDRRDEGPGGPDAPGGHGCQHHRRQRHRGRAVGAGHGRGPGGQTGRRGQDRRRSSAAKAPPTGARSTKG